MCLTHPGVTSFHRPTLFFFGAADRNCEAHLLRAVGLCHLILPDEAGEVRNGGEVHF